MGVLEWVIFGLIVGIVAEFLMPGRGPGGFVITALLGVVGAVLGGFLGRALGWYQVGEPAGFIVAFMGAIIVSRSIGDGGSPRPSRVGWTDERHRQGDKCHPNRGKGTSISPRRPGPPRLHDQSIDATPRCAVEHLPGGRAGRNGSLTAEPAEQQGRMGDFLAH